jgi:uncharacterized membrane protein YbhN (UPF0104 family)
VSALASTACTAGFIVWALHQELPDPPSAPGEVAATLLTIGGYSLVTFWGCERWALLLWRVDRDLPRNEAYRSTSLAVIGNACLPVRVGDAMRVGLVSTASEKLNARSSVGTLMAERVFDSSCHMVLLAAVCLAWFGPSTGGPLGHLPVIAGGLVLLAVGAAVAVRLGGATLARWQPRGRLWEFLAPIFAPLTGLGKGSGRIALLSAGIWLSEIMAWWAGALAVGLPLSLPQVVFVFTIAALALLVPIGFGAIGTLDAAIVVSVEALGMSATGVLGFVLLLRMAWVLPSVFIAAGLGLAGWWSSRATQVEDAAPEAVSP